MRASVLFNRDGTVLAAAIHDEDDYKGPRPVASGDSEVDEFDMPEEMRDRSLDEVFRSMRVDVERRRLVARDDDLPAPA
jgi:hypothetical protein